jgi:hypothetical protein
MQGAFFATSTCLHTTLTLITPLSVKQLVDDDRLCNKLIGRVITVASARHVRYGLTSGPLFGKGVWGACVER